MELVFEKWFPIFVVSRKDWFPYVSAIKPDLKEIVFSHQGVRQKGGRSRPCAKPGHDGYSRHARHSRAGPEKSQNLMKVMIQDEENMTKIYKDDQRFIMVQDEMMKQMCRWTIFRRFRKRPPAFIPKQTRPDALCSDGKCAA